MRGGDHKGRPYKCALGAAGDVLFRRFIRTTLVSPFPSGEGACLRSALRSRQAGGRGPGSDGILPSPCIFRACYSRRWCQRIWSLIQA